jgi:hypothetical protein
MKTLELSHLNGKSVIFGVVALLLLVGCSNKKKQSLDERLPERLVLLVKKKDFNNANILIDSLIYKDKKNGAFYVEKAMIETYLEDFDSSIANLKKAYDLNYEKKACLGLIEFNKSLLKIKHDFESNRHTGKDIDGKKDSILH